MIDANTIPSNEDDLAACLADPVWRICSGQLYNIIARVDDGDGHVIPFRPNIEQVRLIGNIWHRNIILKARQRGFTTLVAILWLDHVLFVADQRVGIVAHDRESAEVIFRDKVKLAYDRLPAALKQMMPLSRDSATELVFAHNNSSIRVATSMRSGTINRLLVSEFGKVCAKYPDKAAEIVTGSLPAVPLDGVIIIESTAEGRDGEYARMVAKAQELQQSGTALTKRDYRFHFASWIGDDTYRIDASRPLQAKDIEYFDGVEAKTGATITPEQRAWYVATRDSDFGGDQERMWQEYPSVPDEAFAVSTEGTYYAVQLAAARKSGRIGQVPYNPSHPVNTFWDIGSSDGTGIWLHQKVGAMHHFIGYIEGWGEPYEYYTRKLQALGYMWGTHYLPHDADHKRQQGSSTSAPIDMLRALGLGGIWSIVPRVSEISHGIQLVRQCFAMCAFDDSCKAGLEHLGSYRKTWNDRAGCWSDQPRHDIHSECADAFRQFAQVEHLLGRRVAERTTAARAPAPKLFGS